MVERRLMTFKAIVDWYNDLSQKEEKKGIFVVADSYKESIEKLVNMFGEEDMMSVSIESWAPDDMIIFDLDNVDHDWLFNKIDSDIGKTILW